MVGPMKAGAWGSKPGVGGPTDSSRVGDGAKRQPRDGMVPNMGARKPPNAGGGQRRGTSDSYQEEVIGPRALLDGGLAACDAGIRVPQARARAAWAAVRAARENTLPRSRETFSPSLPSPACACAGHRGGVALATKPHLW